MKRVTGLGGIFFQCQDPDHIKSWYARHLGLHMDAYGTSFEWRQTGDATRKGFTQWSPFREQSDYFAPSEKPFMINYRVADLEALVPLLREEGVTILDEITHFEYGKFVHILDPEGNKIELWEPQDQAFDELAEGRTSDAI